VHICYTSIPEAEVGISQVQDQSGLHSETLSQKKKKDAIFKKSVQLNKQKLH
jgi:hypothetical protein